MDIKTLLNNSQYLKFLVILIIIDRLFLVIDNHGFVGGNQFGSSMCIPAYVFFHSQHIL